MPDLPGCVAASRTRLGAERLIRSAIRFHLEAMREEGTPIPESEDSLIGQLRDMRIKFGVTQADIVKRMNLPQSEEHLHLRLTRWNSMPVRLAFDCL